MPFVQMENISHFLRACQSPPLNLQPHDVFLTVDLYEHKDPAQVLQCLSAFSRVANQLAPSKFPTVIGPKSRAGFVSPQGTGTPTVGGGSYGNRGRGASNASNTSSAYNSASKTAGSLTPTKTGDSNSGRRSPTKNGAVPLSPGGVSSWSKREDEVMTAPAWNINQYGYMGGASQGSMGISFGGRRQITSAGPYVPNMAEKEKKRKEKEAEEERMRLQMEEEERQRRLEREAEEERARVAEEKRWEEETRKLRERERARAEEEKRRWEEEERRWKMDEERRQQEEREAEARLEKERRRLRGNSDARLQGQFLSQYQTRHGISGNNESDRIKELERELELARERERQYERERQERMKARDHQMLEDHDISIRAKEESSKARARSRSRPRAPPHKDSDEVWRQDEREYLRREWNEHHEDEQQSVSPRPLPEPTPPVQLKPNNTGPSSRPLPDPTAYAASKMAPATANPTPAPALISRTDRFLASNPAPQQPETNITYSPELGTFDSTAERDAEDRRRAASQTKTKAGGWASKSLLEREMELERQRQQEWEEGQRATAEAVKKGLRSDGVDGIGGGIDGRFDKGQWAGYTGGDNQNRGNQGIGAGRRQIVGPRPPPGR
jgi:transgelin